MRSRVVRVAFAAAVLHAPLSAASAAGPDLIGPFAPRCSGRISGDGGFVASCARNPILYPDIGEKPYRWSVEEAGPEFLSDVSGAPFDVSRDAEVVVGEIELSLSNGGSTREAFRWTAEGGVERLGLLVDLPYPGQGNPRSKASGVSSDGLVVVGYSTSTSIPSQESAFRWTEAGGMEDLGVLPEHALGVFPSSYASDVSNDGSTIVGQSFPGNDFGRAVLWTDSGIEALPDLPGGIDSASAEAVSADGSVVVGSGSVTETFTDRPKATRWVDGVVQDLGDLPGNAVRSEAYDVSADGEVVVGRSTATGGAGDHTSKAFLWTARMGMRSVEQVLTQDFGIDLGGMVLELASSVSDDGLHIVAVGPGGHYVARLPYLPGHPACDDHEDDDGDGLVDFPDDPGCQSADSAMENPKCDDDLDNDGDGKIDWDGGSGGATPDPQCVAAPWKAKESAPSTCGVGAELAVVLAALALRRKRV